MATAHSIARIDRPGDIKVLVEMSIGTDRGTWWADPSFGSDLWLFRQRGKVDTRTASAVRQEILRCTRWIVDDGLAQSIECEAWLNDKTRVDYRVLVTRPDGSTELIEGVWDGI